MPHDYELYEQKGRHDGHAIQDWNQAEQEVRKEEVTPAQKEVKNIAFLRPYLIGVIATLIAWT